MDDNHKKEFCNNQFDQLDDTKKDLEREVAALETAIAEANDGVVTTTEEITARRAGITALDKSVAEATAQRKEEHADYKDLMANDASAKDLLHQNPKFPD